MPRGYRYVIVAAVGWLALCSPHAEAQVSAKQAQADSRVGDALQNIATTYRDQTERAKSPPKREPCGPEQYDSTDDLCAQWKAADAADTAAFWARLSGFLSLAGLLGVMGALALTWQSNNIARTSAERQIRAYLAIELRQLENWAIGQHPEVALAVINGGQTPAYKMRYYGAVFIDEMSAINSAAGEIKVDDPEPPPDHTVQIGGTYIGALRTSIPLRQDEYDSMMNGTKLLFVAVVVEYEDTFGKSRETRLFTHTGGKLFRDADTSARADGLTRCEIAWMVARKGNNAT